MYRFDERGQPATHFTVAFYGLEQARFPSNFFIRREEEVIDMSITVTGRKMPVTDALRMYAEEKWAIP
ncbi:MAG: HPF/RaiA family ribosome-associated protein [Senegalimassilia faecalis]